MILENQDPEVFGIIEKEKKRQKEGLEMIPSENYASGAVLEAMGSILNDKYAEGYPGRRYYGGNIYIDEIEKLAQQRAREVFGATAAI
ncbi:MAG: Serine hydroxymethyltransferase [Parcubacteria group bacterium GW2011_GWA2_52_8]|nr:MAG: Serine hydroxymethyltransferase [Parcubacteria group bacterium GW2011_GWA2_52_8]